VRHDDLLGLNRLNRVFSVWLQMDHHQVVLSEANQTLKVRYASRPGVIRVVDLGLTCEAFMRSEMRRVQKDFSDVQSNRRHYRVDPNLRGYKVEMRYDPFGLLTTIQVYGLDGRFPGERELHNASKGKKQNTQRRGQNQT